MNYRHGVLMVVLVWSAGVFAQSEDLNVRDPRLNEGKMFAIQFQPRDRTFVVSLIGKPAAYVGPERITVFGRELFQSRKPVNLKIQASSDKYTIVDDLKPNAAIEIEVQDKVTKKREKIKIEQ